MLSEFLNKVVDKELNNGARNSEVHYVNGEIRVIVHVEGNREELRFGDAVEEGGEEDVFVDLSHEVDGGRFVDSFDFGLEIR